MLAGIAAGSNIPEKDFYGVAPEAELVIVRLKPAKAYLKAFFRIPEDKLAFQENDIIAGYQYLINYASREGKPLVLCNAIDTSQYAHDGRGTTSAWLSTQVYRLWGAMIMAVGNEGNARRHYSGTISDVTTYDTVELNVGPEDKGFSMELWGNAPNLYSIDIASPSGEYIPRLDIRIHETQEIKFIFEPTTIYIDYSLVESQSGDQLILLRFSNISQGIWKFRVYGKGIPPMKFNVWLPMNGFITNDTFFIKSDPYITLLSMSCAVRPIAVTAYNIEDDSLYMDSGRGYTRIDTVKPDIAAPGVNILAPSLNQSFAEVTGTSAAAAHTAGIAALLLEWGMVSGKYPQMITQDVKIFMIRGARRNIELTYPNRDWGYGILDVFNVFESIRRR
jgi:subtilisin family serine protease